MNRFILLRGFIFTCLIYSPFLDGMIQGEIDIKGHPLMNKDNLCLLYKLANRVSDTINAVSGNKKQIVAAIGQSPAYLLEMIKLIDEKKNRQGRQYLHVAFSGSFYHIGKGTIDPLLSTEFKKSAHYYRNYLNSIALSEQSLNAEDAEFIVIEVCHTCNGLRSFLSFFTEYTKKPYSIYLQTDCLSRPNLPFHSQRVLLDDKERELTVALANADEFQDRLVPEFRFYDWANVDPLKFSIEKNAPIILKQIKQFVDAPNPIC